MPDLLRRRVWSHRVHRFHYKHVNSIHKEILSSWIWLNLSNNSTISGLKTQRGKIGSYCTTWLLLGQLAAIGPIGSYYASWLILCHALTGPLAAVEARCAEEALLQCVQSGAPRRGRGLAERRRRGRRVGVAGRGRGQAAVREAGRGAGRAGLRHGRDKAVLAAPASIQPRQSTTTSSVNRIII